MLPTWSLALLAVATVSAVSLIGLLVLPARKLHADSRLLLLLVSLACGAMLGNAFIHLLPEAFEESGSSLTSMLVLGGIFGCFAIEKVLRHGPWLCHSNLHTHRDTDEDPHHTGKHECDGHVHPTGYLSVLSDGLENLTDGIVIAVAFLVDTPTGIATAIAVLLHEIPLEVGDFAVMLNAGFSRAKAVMMNLLSASISLLGAGLVLIGSAFVENLPAIVAPLAAGAIVYMAAAGLIPQLQREKNMGRSLLQLAAMSVGVGLMIALTFFE